MKALLRSVQGVVRLLKDSWVASTLNHVLITGVRGRSNRNYLYGQIFWT